MTSLPLFVVFNLDVVQIWLEDPIPFILIAAIVIQKRATKGSSTGGHFLIEIATTTG